MEIKDYIHLYIGQEVITPDGRGKLVGLPWSIVGQDRVSVHFGKMVATKNSIDGGYNKTRNHGEYLIKPQHLTPIVSSEDMDDIHLPGGVQLILRKLSDMTEEEGIKLVEHQSYVYTHVEKVAASNHCFRFSFEYTSSRRRREWTIDYNKLNPEQFAYLLKLGLDLFNLIPAGLAIDKTSLKN